MNWQKLIHVVILLLIVLALSYVIRYSVPALESLELKTLDWRFEWRGVQSVEDSPIVLVTIDDHSFESLHARWPWPRSYYASVIDNLTRAGASVIGIDVILDVEEKDQVEEDRQMAEAVRESGRVVLARKLEQNTRLKSYFYLVEPVPVLKDAAKNSMGLVSVESDADGIYRRYPIAQRYDEEYLSSFAVEVIRKYRGYGMTEKIRPGNGYFDFGEFHIPIYRASSMLINFAGPRGTFPSYSFASVIDDENFDLREDYDLDYFKENLLPDEVFKDKIVLIGSTVSELHDNFPTPFLEHEGAPNEMPGVEILANAVRTILNNTYFAKPSPWFAFLVLLVLVLLIHFISFRFSTLWSTAVTTVIVVLFLLGQFALFSQFQVVMELLLPVMGMSFAFVFTNLYQFVMVQREKRKIMGAFQQYVPAKVIKELLEHPEKLTLGGEERVMSVLFTDVANFTTISETLSPRELVMLINEYLSEMTEIILNYDGIIDKYEGDAIMAEFGAPVYYEDHALKACSAALEMQSHLKQLSRKWRREGKPVLTSRAGINTGNMIVGNMGSKKVFDYTVLGDEVNLASRLEGANKPFGTSIMISDSTYEMVKDVMITRRLDAIVVKGKKKPVQVFELIARRGGDISELIRNMLPIYNSGIGYYENRNWDKAAECFRYCLRLIPDDGPAKLYLKRVVEYSKNPPPENWDGVFQLTSK